MIVNKVGKYRLLEDIKNRGTISIGTLPKGTVLKITGIDRACHKVIGPDFFDWTYWDLPVEPIKEESHGNL